MFRWVVGKRAGLTTVEWALILVLFFVVAITVVSCVGTSLGWFPK